MNTIRMEAEKNKKIDQYLFYTNLYKAFEQTKMMATVVCLKKQDALAKESSEMIQMDLVPNY